MTWHLSSARWAAILVLVVAFLMAPVKASADKVKLVLANPANPGSQERMEQYLEVFHRLHPHIEVELEYVAQHAEFYERTVMQYASGVAPDIINMAVDHLVPYASSGMIMPLDPFIERDGIDLSEYFPDSINIWRWEPGRFLVGEGQVYAMPINWQTSQAFYYNQDLFDQYGVGYPDETWTWDTFVDAGRKLTADFDGDGLADQWGTNVIATTNDFYARVWQAGGEAINDDFTESLATSPEAIEALRWMTEINQIGIAGDNNVIHFEQGMLATLTQGQWHVGLRFPDTIGDTFRYDMAPHPKHPVTGSNVVQAHSNGWAIMSTTQHPQEAWELVKFLTTAEGMRLQAELHSISVSHIPTAREYLYVRDRNIQPHSFYVVADALLTARQPYVGMRSGEISAAHTRALRAAVGGAISPEEAAIQIKHAVDVILREVQRDFNR